MPSSTERPAENSTPVKLPKGTKRPQALARRQPQAVAVVIPPAGPQTIVERLIELAKDPAIDVVKIDALIKANDHVMAVSARQAFDRAFSAMQGELPIINRRGEIVVEGAVRSKFSTYADIKRAVTPVLLKYGFALRCQNSIADNLLTVIGILSHRDGHRETDMFQTARDDSGKKSVIQSWGSARSFGQRYVCRALLDIADEAENGEPGERGREGRRTPKASRPPGTPKAQPETAAGYNRAAGELITEPQLKRLYAIATNSGRIDGVVKAWLLARYGFTSSKQITRDVYDEIVSSLEAKGTLPATRSPKYQKPEPPL